jgi:hypothetical protein
MNSEWVITGIIIIIILINRERTKAKRKPIVVSPNPRPQTPLPNNPRPTKKSSQEIKIENDFNKWKSDKTNELLNFQTLWNLTKIKGPLTIGYKDLLDTLEWQTKRLQILDRDCYTCKKCSKKSEKLHVHHKWYIKDEFPWEIEDDGLVALCHHCHKEVHLTEEISVYGKNMDGTMHPTLNFNIYCNRCSGAGWFPQYKHVEDGICFKCRGDSISSTIFSAAILNYNKQKTQAYEDKILENIEKLFLAYDINFYKKKVRPMYPDLDLDLPF